MSPDASSELGDGRSRATPHADRPTLDRSTRFPTAAAAVSLSALIALAFAASRELASDDVFITYGFARNLATGHGFTWAGEPSLGTTSPFLALLLAALERLVPLGIPAWGHLLTWLAVSLLCATLLDAGRREGWHHAAFVACLLLIPAPIVARHVGFEWFPALACLGGAMSLFARGRPLAAGALLALAGAFRSEAAMAALPFVVAWLATGDRRRTARRIAGSLVVAGTLVLTWLVVLQRLAGGVVPSPLAAKRAQAASGLLFWQGGFPAALRSFWAYLRDYGPIPSSAALTVLLVVGAWIAGRGGIGRRPTMLFFLSLGPLVSLALVVLGVPIYSWYAIPLSLSSILLVAMPAEATRLASGTPGLRRALEVLVALAAVLGASTLIAARWQERGAPGNRSAYLAMARAADRFPAGTRVGAFEVGYLGWFSRQPVVDLLGLVTADVKPEEIARREFRSIRDRLGVDLLVFWLQGGPLLQATFGTASDFYDRFELEAIHRDDATALALYRRLPLPSRNGIEIDLTALAARSGKRIVGVQRRNRGGFTLVLEPGEELEFELPSGAGRHRFETSIIGLRGPGRIRLLDRSAIASTPVVAECDSPMGTWSDCSKDLAGAAESRRFAVRCTTRHGRCGLLAPLVRQAGE